MSEICISEWGFVREGFVWAMTDGVLSEGLCPGSILSPTITLKTRFLFMCAIDLCVLMVESFWRLTTRISFSIISFSYLDNEYTKTRLSLIRKSGILTQMCENETCGNQTRVFLLTLFYASYSLHFHYIVGLCIRL